MGSDELMIDHHSHMKSQMTTALRFPALRTALTALAVFTTACSAPDAPEAAAELPHRFSDGLLHNPTLQAVVDAQEARDARGLMVALDHGDPLVRARAAYGLASVRAPEAAPRLIARLEDTDSRVRSDAAFALGQIDPVVVMSGEGPAAGVEAALWARMAAESDHGVRLALIEALGRVGGEATMERLMALQVDDLEELAAVNLAISLGLYREVAPESAWERLARDVSHADPGVRRAAWYGFDRVEYVSTWSSQRGAVRAALDAVDFDDPAAFRLLRPLARAMDVYTAPRLRLWLKNGKDWRAREAAATGLASRKNLDTWALLLQSLDDPSIHVRIAAATAMSNEPTPERFVEPLARWIEANPDLYAVTGILLEQLGRSGFNEPIEVWMSDHDWTDADRSAVAVRVALATDGEDAVDWLWQGTEAADANVRNAAFQGIVQRWGASQAFAQTHDFFREGFVRLMRGPDDRVSVRAAGLLGDSILVASGGGAALRMYLDELSEQDDAARVAAVVSSLERDPAPQAEAILRERANSTNPRVARVALMALSARTGESVDLPAIPAPAAPSGPAPHSAVDWHYLQELGEHPLMVVETVHGRFVLQLNTSEAPLTVQGITSVARSGQYDGVPFHRVVSNFVVQGGDVSNQNGTGSAGFRLKTEAARTPFHAGVLGMARNPSYDSEGSQFFVTHSAQPHLEGYYTVFGQVIEGQSVVDQIAQGDRMLSVTVVPDARAGSAGAGH